MKAASTILLAALLLLAGCASPKPPAPIKIINLPAPIIGAGDQYAKP